MKRNRIIWLVLWILSLVGVSFYGGVISYGFFTAMTLVPIVSLLYLLYVYVFFRIYQKIDARTLVVNKAVPFFFTLVNEYVLAFAGVRVRFFTSFSTINGLSDETEYELLPHTGVNKETNLVCSYRGDYQVGIKRVEVQDFFRLFKVSYKNRDTLRVIVKPQLVYLDNISSFDANLATRDADVNRQDPDVLTREYVIGDDIRRMNWSQTARTGSMMVREQIGEEQHGISILMDCCRYSEKEHYYIPVENKMLELVLALTYFFCEKGIPSKEYYLEGDELSEVSVSKENFNGFYEIASNVTFRNDKSCQILFAGAEGKYEIFRSNAVFMILHKWNESAESFLRKLMDGNLNTVVFIVNDDENSIPAGAPTKVRFIRIGTGDDIREVL